MSIQLTELNSETQNKVEQFLSSQVLNLRGSMSAEHGMGFLKSKYLSLNNTDGAVRLMKNVKRIFDPNGIMNPYKVLL